MGKPSAALLIRREFAGGTAAPSCRDCTRRAVWIGPEDSAGGSAKEATGAVVLRESRW
jgi:hypothetical protein